MSIQTEPSTGGGESGVTDQIQLARLVKSDAALKQEVASLKEANRDCEQRLVALEVKHDGAKPKVE